ncbi:hypothetical protein U1Q18_026264 [Sarracenia purpurea var. burkii]
MGNQSTQYTGMPLSLEDRQEKEISSKSPRIGETEGTISSRRLESNQISNFKSQEFILGSPFEAGKKRRPASEQGPQRHANRTEKFGDYRNYDFRYSLVDIPLVSLLRSAVILCVYSLCDGPSLSRGPYLVTATVCSVTSLVFVSLKAYFAMGGGWSNIGGGRRGYGGATEVGLFVCSLVLGAGHVVVAYRTRCRERRKLLVYKIDIEAVSACKNGFPGYYKVLQQERVK